MEISNPVLIELEGGVGLKIGLARLGVRLRMSRPRWTERHLRRVARAIYLRCRVEGEHLTFADVGRDLGVTRQRAHELFSAGQRAIDDCYR